MKQLDNRLQVRLSKEYQQMFAELCQHHRRTPADMMRLLIEDAHKAMKEKQQ